jgi:hypothetical protein
MREMVPRLSSAYEQQHVGVLLRYIDKSFRAEYSEADNLFAKGLVSEKHFSKLFVPGEVVVTMTKGQPVAYTLRDLPKTNRSSLSLIVEDWHFDGVFGRKEGVFNIAWPFTSSETLPITDLEIFPLRFDGGGTKERLLKRGQLLWNCRKRKYMSYKGPAGHGGNDEAQTVSITQFTYKTVEQRLNHLGLSEIHD